MVMHKRALLALLLCVGVLSLAALACTSDQEWIIPRTATPTPTFTPVPMNVDTQYHTGDTIRIVGNAFQVWQTTLPEADRRNNRVIGTQCFPGQTAPVIDVADGSRWTYLLQGQLHPGWLGARDECRTGRLVMVR